MNSKDIRFPQSFLWGAATSAHQVEGNNVNSDWWVREHSSVPYIRERSGDACDSYHRYREDMTLLADAGFNAYRFSLEWSRIEPEQGYFSYAALAHYRRMVETCQQLGLTPVVTLHHFTLPRWMHELGGWRNVDAPSWFARFTEAALAVVSDGVEWVCTINEPNMVAMFSTAEQNPEILTTGTSPEPDQQVSEALTQAHRQSRDVLASVQSIKSGWTVGMLAVQPEPGSEQAALKFRRLRQDDFLTVAQDDDFIGVQAYSRNIVGPEGRRKPGDDVETTLNGVEYYPAALGIGVREAWDVTKKTPILVTENGIATNDDSQRISYTQEALTDLNQALGDGIDVRGYIHWSALDNYEWGSYAPTFGLISIDHRNFARRPKPSLAWLGECARNGLIKYA